MARMSYALWVWGPAVLLMAAIFWLSAQSALPVLPGGMSDVFAHAVTYAGLGSLMLRALSNARWSGVTPRLVAVAIALTVLYGVSDEYHQSFVDGRFAEVRDVIADALGACSGAGAVWAWSIVFFSDQRSKIKDRADDL
jgi:VanZ family protein